MPHSNFLSQVIQVGFWGHRKQIWSTHWVDWEDDLRNEDNLRNEDDLNYEDDLKYEDSLKNEDDLKNDDDLKNEGNLKNEDYLKNWPFPQIMLPPSPLKSYLKFFWWLLTLTATQQLMSNRICYQVSKPEMEFHMIDIIYAALPMGAQTEKTTFSCKDD